MWYLFSVAVILAVGLTWLVMKLALKIKLLDYPDPVRKFHAKPTPLLGGWAIFLSFTLVSWFLVWLPGLLGRDVSTKQLLAITVGGLFLLVGGYFDDRYHWPPSKQIIWGILAVLIVVAGGIGVKYVSNPLGGLLYLDTIKISLYHWQGVPYYLTLWADLFTVLWLLGMMYTTKLLDGLDGLVSGIGIIGSLIIFSLTQLPIWYQPSVGRLSIILAGAALGFLIWNWHPAKIFLGEGGSLYVGFMLGILAIISGGKIATALLVMGIPILDVVWVILRRLFWDKKSLAAGDRKHLHYRLLEVGLTHRQSVLVLYFLTAIFGITSLFLRTQGKLLALGVMLLVMIILAGSLVYLYKKRRIPS